MVIVNPFYKNELEHFFNRGGASFTVSLCEALARAIDTHQTTKEDQYGRVWEFFWMLRTNRLYYLGEKNGISNAFMKKYELVCCWELWFFPFYRLLLNGKFFGLICSSSPYSYKKINILPLLKIRKVYIYCNAVLSFRLPYNSKCQAQACCMTHPVSRAWQSSTSLFLVASKL